MRKGFHIVRESMRTGVPWLWTVVAVAVVSRGAGGDCPGDLSGDGVVGSTDVGMLLAAWGTADRDADLDGSGVVDGGDYGAMLEAWGPCDTCVGDLDGDGVVSGTDLGHLFMAWGDTGGSADLDGDGVVGGGDFGLLLKGWGACSACVRPAFVHGDPSILAELHDRRTSVLMIGDSISNWGSTQFTSLFHGAICTWKPVSWRGVYTSPASGGPQGHWVGFGTQSAPGIASAFLRLAPDLAGHYTGYAEAFPIESGESIESEVLRGLVSHAIFQDDSAERPRLYGIGRPFENAAGEVDFVNRPGPIEMGFTVLTNGSHSAAGRAYAAEIRMASYRAGVVEHPSTIAAVVPGDGPGISRITAEWMSQGMSGSTANATSEIRIFPATPAPESQVLVVQDLYFGRPDHEDGLTLAYAGHGGWRVANHLHPYGSPELPQVGTEHPGYSDQALENRVVAIEATHYFIHLGTNDFGSPNMTAESYLSDLEAFLQRLRRIHAETGMGEPRFVVLGLYLTALDDEQLGRPRKDAVRLAMMEWADRAEDLVYLDLMGRVSTRFDMSNIDVANPFAEMFLWDDVHPNAAGAEWIASWIWSRVEASLGCPH